MIISRTLRVPRSAGPAGDGAVVARQLDVVLAGVGFKAARDLMEHVSGLAPGAAVDLSIDVLAAVRELVGDHVEHNAYFIDFPRNVPGTVEFWVSCLRATVGVAVRVDLLTLPTYGRYQHTYAELLAAHDELLASAKDRVTVLHLGGTLIEEQERLYLDLAGSTTPLGEADLALLARLAEICRAGTQPRAIPVRENRAVVNTVRMAAGLPLVAVDTVVDVLRLVCHASGGDVTLATPTRFRSFTRRERRVLLGALDRVVAGNRGKLGDVARHAGAWKRLAVGLHPYEHRQFPRAREVFDVARGDVTVRSLPARAELAIRDGRPGAAAEILTGAPGMLVRSLDRLLRQASDAETDVVVGALESVLGRVSGRVLCSLREHLANRDRVADGRVFATRGKRAWATVDARLPLPHEVIGRVGAIVDAELAGRLPGGPLVVDPVVLDVALPLSGKASEDGFAVLPRGSRTVLDGGDVLRFFTYWRQRADRTDFDLSALLLDERFEYEGHVSWTNYDHDGLVYSGDLTEAPDGATEFIDVPLTRAGVSCVVPQVNIYAGEGFDTVAESMFGWMVRGADQRGAPFEARTVRTRSDLRGGGRVALPVVFTRDADGRWHATWLHLYLPGEPHFNRVEGNHASTGRLVRAIVDRRYLTVAYLVDLMRRNGSTVTPWTRDAVFTEPVTYVGLTRPDGLPDGSTVLDLGVLNQLIPS